MALVTVVFFLILRTSGNEWFYFYSQQGYWVNSCLPNSNVIMREVNIICIWHEETSQKDGQFVMFMYVSQVEKMCGNKSSVSWAISWSKNSSNSSSIMTTWAIVTSVRPLFTTYYASYLHELRRKIAESNITWLVQTLFEVCDAVNNTVNK